jgi:hypothetical protein
MPGIAPTRPPAARRARGLAALAGIVGIAVAFRVRRARVVARAAPPPAAHTRG